MIYSTTDVHPLLHHKQSAVSGNSYSQQPLASRRCAFNNHSRDAAAPVAWQICPAAALLSCYLPAASAEPPSHTVSLPLLPLPPFFFSRPVTVNHYPPAMHFGAANSVLAWHPLRPL